MAFTNIWQWSETAGSNTEIDGISLTENVMVPSDVNNALREMMSQIITTEGKGTAIASAATLTLSGPERYFHITGSTGPITDIDFTDAVDGRWAWLIFDSTPTITHNATTLKLPGNANIVAAAGDRALFVQDSSDNVICLAYNRATGLGELLQTQVLAGAAFNIGTGSPTDVATLNLTAGDWDVTGQVYFTPAATTSITQLASSLSTTTATMDNTTLGAATRHACAAFVPGSNIMTYPIGPLRVSLAATTTYYLVASAIFTVSTLSVHGIIRARRVL
jgi:hypothetical protein